MADRDIDMKEYGERKAAFLISLLSPDDQDRFIATLAESYSDPLRSAISYIRRRGWNRREVVEATLGLQLDAMRGGDLRVEELLFLSQHLDSTALSRVVVASNLAAPHFFVSLLPDGYRQGVQAGLAQMPVMNSQVRNATLAAARRLLDEVPELVKHA